MFYCAEGEVLPYLCYWRDIEIVQAGFGEVRTSEL